MRCWFTAVVTLVLALTLASLAYGEVVITHLTYTNHGTTYNDYIRAAASEFTKAHPDIRIDVIEGKQDKMQTMMVAGVWPDVLDMPDFDYLGATGVLMDIKPFLQRDNLLKMFNPVLLGEITQQNGALYRVPMEVSVIASYFNRDLFNNMGLKTPDRMSTKEWTWDTLVSYGRKLTRDANGDGKPEEFGIDRAQAYWQAAVFQAGGTFYEFDKNDKPLRSLWNTPEVIQGIQHVQNIFQMHITPFNTVPTSEISKYYFWLGKSAIDVTDGMGIINLYLKNPGFDWDFALQPAGPVGPITNGANLGGAHIMANTKNPDAVWEWVKYFAMNKENLAKWVLATGRLPGYLPALAEYPALMKIATKNFNAVLSQANYPPKRQAATDNTLSPRFVNLNEVWAGTVPAATFAQAQHEKTTAIISELRAKLAANVK